MSDTLTLKTDEKLDELALRVVNKHNECMEALQAKEEARQKLGGAGGVVGADLFRIRSQILLEVAGQYKGDLRRLYEKAAELNADMLPKRGEGNHVKILEAEKQLKHLLNEHIGDIATAHGLPVAEDNAYYVMSSARATAAS